MAITSRENRTFELRSITSLQEHPLNSKAFDDLSDESFQSLKADIEARGLDHPIDILPNGLIIAGHQRVRACRELGHEKIRCRVRHDLADASTADIATAMINDNVRRRQLSPLQEARAMWTREQSVSAEQGYRLKKTDLTEKLAKKLGASERHARRYLRVLDTPREVLDAFERGSITLVLAEKVAKLEEAKLKQVAARLRMGDSPRAVVEAACGENKGRSSSAERQLTVPEVTAGVARLANLLGGGKWIPPRQANALREAVDALVGVMARA